MKGMIMFREIRKKKQVLSMDQTIKILQSGTSGVLAVSGDDDYPYAVPLSYAYENGKLFFHGATAGHKLDALVRNEKVSFCVIEKDEVIPEAFTTYYRSAIAFGKARILTDDNEKKHALECLVQKYSTNYMVEGQSEIAREWDKVSVFEVNIEHLTGKAAIEIIGK